MAQAITIPRLGWSMEEGVFVEWLKAPGELVRAGEMVFALEGEKAAQEIESFDSGYLCVPGDAPSPGTTVKVGQVIGFLLVEGEVPPDSVGKTPLSTATSANTTEVTAIASPQASRLSQTITSAPPVAAAAVPRAVGPAARRLARALGIEISAVSTPDPTGRVLSEDIQRTANNLRSSIEPMTSSRSFATPRARRRAKELGVDWTQLRGTGRNGRIRERDVKSLPRATTINLAESLEPEPITPGKFTPATKLRRILAQRMHAGANQAAPVTIATTVDAAPLVACREHYKSIKSDGPVPSFNDILIGLAARALRDLPELNACWYRDGVYVFDAIHIATAVDTSAGLLAPVIRDTDQLSMVQIAQQTRQLIEQARAGRLNQTHLEGGTFTVSNLGMFGIDSFTPILNLPQAGILGVGRIVDAPVVRAGKLEVGLTLTLSLTFDHRVIDGAPAARWLQYFCQLISQLASSN